MNIEFKKSILPEIVIVLIFFIAAAIYCSPVLNGDVIAAGDKINGYSAVQEALNYSKEGGNSWWTGSMFSGMPNYQIGGGKYLSSIVLKPFTAIFKSGQDNQIMTIFLYLVAFYVMMRCWGVKRMWSISGAFAVALSSYFLIIIGAAHGGKTASITNMALVMVGMLLIYQKRYGWGSAFVMFFMAMGYTAHPQMAYYICMLIGVLFCAELYNHIKEKRMREWAIATALFVTSFIIGFGTNMANTFANSEYLEQTMRGGHSDLVQESEGEEQKSKGLDFDYATAWSYGVNETLTLLIPNYMGGSSNYDVGRDSDLYRSLIKQGVAPASAMDFCKNVPTYWGDQPFTAGPVYIGAIICLLFVMGLIVVKGAYKWALLAATLFSILLSWGYHFEWFSRLFFDYFPLYNKFRAVSSILVVAEITMPLIALLAIKEISEREQKSTLVKPLLISTAITAGICLIFVLFGSSICSFTSANDAQFASQLPQWLMGMIYDQREYMLKSDALRSLIFIIAAASLLFIYIKGKAKECYVAVVITLLIVADMWGVDKRYFNDSHFVSKRAYESAFAMQPYEKEILKDKDPHFRVLNLATNTFNDGRTSYYLKSIGGYSAAKLRRYQDIIEQHLSQMHWPVINMLNAKYIITPDENGTIVPMLNDKAMGNCWFVDDIYRVSGANNECNALNEIDLHTQAVVDIELFGEYVDGYKTTQNDNASITLTKYAPDYVEYESSNDNSSIAIFSEIYYPYGWQAYIDGKEVEHFRANYILRALNVPAGEHTIRFEFNPKSVKRGDTLSLIFIILMFASMGIFVGRYIYIKRKI